jgi:hypothetical protein
MGAITLKRILKKWDVGIWTYFICFRMGTSGSEHGNVAFSLIESGEFLGEVRGYQRRKENFASWNSLVTT